MREQVVESGRVCSDPRRSRRPLALVVAATLLAGVACGATDPGGKAGEGAVSESLPRERVAEQGRARNAREAASAATGASNDGGTSSVAGGTSLDGTGASPVPGVTGGGPVRGGSLGVGVTKTTVTVGAFELKNGTEFLAAFGVKGGAGLDNRAAQNALASYINAHGGLGGRRVEIVYHALDATSTDTYAAIAQAACADFTQDHHVFAVIGAPFQMVPCLDMRGVVALGKDDQAGDAAFLAKYQAIYYAPSSLGYERKARAWVAGLAQQGFLGRGTFGLLYYDVDGMPASVASSLRPAMKAHGVAFAREIEIPFPQSTADAASTVAAIQSAVLRFKTEGIDHVLLYDVNGTMPVFFMREADSQQYEPRYALNSDSHLEFARNNVPAAQLRQAVGVGWRPSEDVTKVQAANSSDARCRQIMTKSGIKLPDSATAAAAVTLCDLWFFLKDGLDRTEAPNAAGFRSAVEGFGTTWMSPRTYTTRFASGRPHDGVAAIRNVAYRESCSCWELAGSVQKIN